MARRSRAVFCGVSAGNSAAVSSGPMVAKKVVKATSAVSSMSRAFQHAASAACKPELGRDGRAARPAHRTVTSRA